MHFKKPILAIVLLLHLPLLITCARESLPTISVIDVKLKGGARCLSEFGSEMRRYFAGRMSEAEVAGFWDCAIQTVYDFQRLTAGENGGDSYSPQALRRFLYKHFLDSRMLSDGLLASIMEIKRVFLSGSPDTVTREELRRLTGLLTEIKFAAMEMRPHVAVLFSTKQNVSGAEIDQALLGFERASSRLGAWLNRYQEQYSFQQLSALFGALREWMSEGGSAPEWGKDLENALQIVAPAKRLLVGGPESRIEGREWQNLLNSLGGLFRLYTLGRYAFKADLNGALVSAELPAAMELAASLLESAVRQRGVAGIPLGEYDDFFAALERAGLLPESLSARPFSAAFRWFVARPLGGGKNQNVKAAQMQNFMREAHTWRVLLRRADGDTWTEFPDWTQFMTVLNASSPMDWDHEGRLLHLPAGPAKWTPSNMRRMVWPFAVLNWVKKSYVGSSPTMSEADLSLAVSEILPVLQGFGWLTSTKLTIGKRLLREADLFTLASNGDFALDLNEAVRYLAFVASAFRTSELWLHEAEQKCGSTDATCVRDLATRIDSLALGAYPRLRQQVLAEPKENFIRYMRQAEETILSAPISGPVKVSDLLQVQMLFQYVETFLRDFDQSGDERIELYESLVAYQRYGPTLGKLLSSSGLAPDEVLAFFTFMMKYGDTPFAMFGGQVYFTHWKFHRNDWTFLADRTVLMSILNQLSKL